MPRTQAGAAAGPGDAGGSDRVRPPGPRRRAVPDRDGCGDRRRPPDRAVADHDRPRTARRRVRAVARHPAGAGPAPQRRRRQRGRAAAPAAPAGTAAKAGKPDARPPDKPAEPNVIVSGERRLGESSGLSPAPEAREPRQAYSRAGRRLAGKSRVQEVRLRGAVVFHQDPAPGKARGTDVSGEAVDVINLGEGKSLLRSSTATPSPPGGSPATSRPPAAAAFAASHARRSSPRS